MLIVQYVRKIPWVFSEIFPHFQLFTTGRQMKCKFRKRYLEVVGYRKVKLDYK